MVGTPDLNVLIGGDPEGEDLGENDRSAGSREVVDTPELARGLGFVDGELDIVFESVARRKRPDGKVFLLQVAVERRFTGDGGSHIDSVGGRRVDGCPVGFVYADELDERNFVGGGIGEGEHAELLGSALGLEPEKDVDLTLAGAVGVHSVGGLGSLEDHGLIGKRIGRSRFVGRLCERGARQKEGGKDRAQSRENDCAEHLPNSLIRKAGYATP